MNWIKSNPFVATLIGITALLCIGLFLLGSRWSGKYDAALESFEESYQSVKTSESIGLYPKAELRDSKRNALVEYGAAIEKLRSKFDPYRPGELANVSPQDFTAALKQANKEVTTALKAAECEVPEGFLMGFQRYNNEFATEKATGVLNYQLQGLKHALLQLAESRPSALLSVYRDEIPEESGAAPQADPNQVSRNFGCEIAFKSSEDSVRTFLNSLGKVEPYYYVVRCLKVRNEKTDPPKVSDAQFEKKSALAPAAPGADTLFGGAFVLPGADESVPEETPSAEADPKGEFGATAQNPVVEEKAGIADSSRILAQVLGSEELIVFVRFDLTLFLPTKELPKP